MTPASTSLGAEAHIPCLNGPPGIDTAQPSDSRIQPAYSAAPASDQTTLIIVLASVYTLTFKFQDSQSKVLVMSEFVQACKAAKAAYLKGSAAQVRQAVDRALQDFIKIKSRPDNEVVALMIFAIEADIVSTQFEEARQRIHSCLLLAQGLPTATREDARLEVQSLQLMLALKEGDLNAAAELCVILLNPANLVQRAKLTASKFLRVVTELLRELGLNRTALDVVDFVERRLLPELPEDRLAVELGLHHFRIVIALQALGRSPRSLGPLGWQSIPKEQSECVLTQSLSAIREAAEQARLLGLDAYTAQAHWLVDAATTNLRNPQEIERRIQVTLARSQYFRKAGLLCDLPTIDLELVGLYVAAGQLHLAAAPLKQIREKLRHHRHVARLEEWYWQMYRYQHETGQTALALSAYQKYANLADARRDLASQLLTSGHRQFMSLCPDDCPRPAKTDTLLSRVRAVANTTETVEALAAGLNLSTRRLQQLLKAEGLPPPAAHLRAVKLNSSRRSASLKGAESIWGQMPL